MGPSGAPAVSPGDHACCTFATDDEQAELVSRFARDAVERNDRVFYLADRADEAQVAGYVTDGGLDGRAMLDGGALQVLHSSQIDLAGGFDRNRMLTVWRQLTEAARDDGYRGLAVLAEMSWALSRDVDADTLIDYEETSGSVFASKELSAICQYDRRLFDDETLQRAGHAHSVAMRLGGAGCTVDHHRLLIHLGRVLEVGGEVDLANVHFLDQILVERLAHGDAVADCTMLTFIDAGGCRVLRAACNGELGPGRLTLRNVPEGVQRVMEVFERIEGRG
jgi:anti-anti-sigma regulatory factor